MYTSKTIWKCTNDSRKSVDLTLKREWLIVNLIGPNNNSDLTILLEDDRNRQNKNIREIAEAVLLHFGLSYVEQTKIAGMIRRMINQVL
jgi:hypothetical protein